MSEEGVSSPGPSRLTDWLDRPTDHPVCSLPRQASNSAAGFLSLALLAGGRLREGKVVVTGEVDLRGRVSRVRSEGRASAPRET